MPKLYVFAIGGTGSRVVKSLTMLLASGIKTNYEIVPIILDPDAAAADVEKTTRILNNYKAVNKYVNLSAENSLFKNKIESLGDVVNPKTNENISNEFRLNINDLHGGSFRSFIDFNLLEGKGENEALIELLFSDQNLNLDLEVGFQGNPNIGSVVLNKFVDSPEFIQFAQNFTDQDRIFIISSIFGGTGAAGFPLILKNIREGKFQGQHYEHLRNAVVGAITVLPYFKLDGDVESAIQSSTFISKTKAALSYYHTNISSSHAVNALYYIGDTASNNYKNIVGGSEQKNDAHFIELAAAMAVLDFVADESLRSMSGRALTPKYKEFGIDSIDASNPVITFPNLALATQNLIKENLSQLFFTTLYLDNELALQMKAPFAANQPAIDKNFLTSHFYQSLQNFQREFKIWLAELKRNKISFSPYEISVEADMNGNVTGFSTSKRDIFTLLHGVPKKSAGLNFLKNKSYDVITGNLNTIEKSRTFISAESKMLELFTEATKQSINKELF
ncbi:hypothetical protein PQ465_15380 [Sphingobacterium oryzagri]|uniref:Tubulin/FtsZ family, GTPase domain n=1 Tax=Sphingobacterium oryzagri TaxID=3025669 RepID=A0ABY7WDU4_9SPHI|nr:hypothetical protein [Sphingobacterium sp. KACC 22765]WDF67682.1 hypothetical protein PQ465_15380 [Sphingobacterium sp. KACC 22765]